METVKVGDQLDSIASEARALDAGAQHQPGPGGEPAAAETATAAPNVDAVEVWSQIPTTLGQAVVPAMPELAATYTPANCRAWGVAMEKYAQAKGWNVGDKAPGVMLFFASAGFVLSTFVAVIKRLIAAKRARAAAGGQARTVTVDQPAAPAAAAASGAGAGVNG